MPGKGTRALEHPTVGVLIIAMCALFVFETTHGLQLSERWGATPARIKQAWRGLREDGMSLAETRVLSTVVTAGLLHGSTEHIVYNMVFLWTFGSLASLYLGKWWVLALFFLCDACGNVTQTLLNSNSEIPIIGASGAVSGFEGVYLGLALSWRLNWPHVWPLARPIPPMQLGLFALVGFGYDLVSIMNRKQGIAFGAHVGGFLAGLLVAGIITALCPSQEAFRRH